MTPGSPLLRRTGTALGARVPFVGRALDSWRRRGVESHAVDLRTQRLELRTQRLEATTAEILQQLRELRRHQEARWPLDAGQRFVGASLHDELADCVADIPVDLGGGASLLKVLVLADLVIAHRLLRVVEIGVYHGRLLLPLGLVMRRLDHGEAVGIDPYSALAAVQTDEHQRGFDLAGWVRSLDWEGVYLGVLERIERHGVTERCRIIRRRSADVAAEFAPGSIDLLHVDGNHDDDAVAADVELYLPKIRSGGFLVLDDASWASVRPVLAALVDAHELFFQLFEPASGNDFAVVRLSREEDPGAGGSAGSQPTHRPETRRSRATAAPAGATAACPAARGGVPPPRGVELERSRDIVVAPQPAALDHRARPSPRSATRWTPSDILPTACCVGTYSNG